MRKFVVLLLGVASAGMAHASVVYQTVQPTSAQSAQYHTFITQVSGNASQNFGDEIKLGQATTDRYLTNITVPTQTFTAAQTPAYNPAFIELRLWPNDGPPSADGTVPDGNPTPGSLPFAVARVTGASYPVGGNHASGGTLLTFNFQPTSTYNYTGAAGGDGLFVNDLQLPERFTVTIVNLNAQGVQDGSNPDGNQWGPYLSGGATSNIDPDGNPLTDNNDTTYNTNEVGNSRTGPFVTATNNGHWVWNQQNGSAPGTNWVDSRTQNLVLSMTIDAVPEPANLAGLMLAGAALLRRRRQDF